MTRPLSTKEPNCQTAEPRCFPPQQEQSPHPKNPTKRVMASKRPVEVVAPEPEQEAAAGQSPRKRLRRTVLVMMWLNKDRGARGVVTIEQMAQLIRQMQVEMAKLFTLLMVLVVRLCTTERMLLELPHAVERLIAGRLDSFQRSFMGAIGEMRRDQVELIRSAVHREMQERQAASPSNGVHQPPRQNKSEGFPESGGSSRMFQLRFVDSGRPNELLYTGCPVQWQNGTNVKVAIFENEIQITQGNLSNLQIEILPVHDDFFTKRGQANFTKEEFNKQIYMCNGKESVLETTNLTNGEAYLGSFCFTESSHMKKLRLAARVKSQDLMVRVQEAVTDPFVVKDYRSKLNEKRYPPSKEDDIHRLEKISLKGKHCNDLVGKGITKVKHLLRYYHRDKSGLQKLTGMKEEAWNTMIKHATTSDPGDEIYSYFVADENVVLFFNDFYDLVGVKLDGFYVAYSKLHQLQQIATDRTSIFFLDDLEEFTKHKVNSWRTSAHRDFEELENLGSLVHDHVMIDGLPVPLPVVFPKTDVSLAQVFPNNDAGPSTQATVPLHQYPIEQTIYQEFGQQDPSVQQNKSSYYLPQENILNGIPPHNIATVSSANLSVECNGYLSSSTIDAAGTTCPVTDEIGHQTSFLSPGQPDINIFSDQLPHIGEELAGMNNEHAVYDGPALANNGMNYEHAVYDGSALAINEELVNSDSSIHGNGNGGHYHFQ